MFEGMLTLPSQQGFGGQNPKKKESSIKLSETHATMLSVFWGNLQFLSDSWGKVKKWRLIN